MVDHLDHMAAARPDRRRGGRRPQARSRWPAASPAQRRPGTTRHPRPENNVCDTLNFFTGCGQSGQLAVTSHFELVKTSGLGRNPKEHDKAITRRQLKEAE